MKRELTPEEAKEIMVALAEALKPLADYLAQLSVSLEKLAVIVADALEEAKKLEA